MTRCIAKVALLLAALAASGCGLFRNRTARLTWPPPGAEPAPAPPPSAPAVSLQPLEDRRSEPGKVIGEVGFFDVETPDDVATWATAALHDELRRAGVRVVPRAADVPVMGGELRHVRAWSGTLHYYGVVELRAWMRSGDAVTYNAQVRGEGKAGSALKLFDFYGLFDTGERFAAALADAARDASRKVATAVAQAPPAGSPCPPDAPCAPAPATPPREAAPGLEPAATVTAPPPPEEPPLRARSGWYLGVLLGWPFAEVTPATGATAFDGQTGGLWLIPMALGVQLGFPVGRRLLLGGACNVSYPWYTYSDRDLLISQVLANATFHPLERAARAPGEREVAPRGWFLRGGAGAAFLRSRPDTFQAPPGSASWAASGWALSAGTGWARWAGPTRLRTVNAGLDLAWQFYGSGAAEQAERSFTLTLSAGTVLF
jgi:hypothetical protein